MSGALKPKILKSNRYWKIISKETSIEKKAAEIKKYFKFKISNLHKRYATNNVKKNLKNVIDFINLVKFSLSYPSKYIDLRKLKIVEIKITQKNKKMIFIEKSNLVFNIVDFKLWMPNKQNSITLVLTNAFQQ